MATISRYLPDSHHRLLVGIVAVIAALYGLLAVVVAINALSEPMSLAVAVPLAVMSWGMWRLKRWARRITVFALWFGVIVVPLGVLKGFAIVAPSLEILVTLVALGIALGLFVLHVLGMYREEFGS